MLLVKKGTREMNPAGYFLYDQQAKEWEETYAGTPNSVPLYKHPVELTDEEIMDELVKVKHTWVATTSVWFEFEKEELKKAIRAILRKAQEK